MKPSERIEEIYNSKRKIFINNDEIHSLKIQCEDYINSILAYLDEEYVIKSHAGTGLLRYTDADNMKYRIKKFKKRNLFYEFVDVYYLQKKFLSIFWKDVDWSYSFERMIELYNRLEKFEIIKLPINQDK